MKIKIFCRCSLFPSWWGYGLISTPVYEPHALHFEHAVYSCVSCGSHIHHFLVQVGLQYWTQCVLCEV